MFLIVLGEKIFNSKLHSTSFYVAIKSNQIMPKRIIYYEK